MKIMIINHEFPPIGGGAGRSALNLSKEFVKFGHSVEVITTSFNRLFKIERSKALTVYRVFGARRSKLDNIVWLTFPSFLIFGSLAAIWRYYRTKPDKVFCFMTVPAGAVGCILKMLFSAWICVAVRGSDVPGYNPKQGAFSKKLLRVACRRIWPYCDARTAVVAGQLRQVLATSPNLDFKVIHNGVDTDTFRPMPGNRKKNQFSIVTVSRITELKGIQFLVEAIHHLRDRQMIKDLRVSIIGSGNYRAEIARMINEFALNDNIQMLGEIDHEKLPAFYSDADLFVLPTLSEAFGNVTCEAMACGLPVVCTNVGGLPEVVKNERNGFLVEPGNAVALAESILKMANSPEQRSEMSAYNRSYVKNNFTWAAAANKYLAL